MTGTTTAAADIRALLDSSAAAWNRGDGIAYGAHFTDDATDVTYVGTVYRGGPEIGRAHQDLFDSFLKGTTLTLEILDLRLLGPDTAVVVTCGGVHKGRRPGRPDKRATYTVVRTPRDGRWRIAAVQKTAHRRLLEAFSFRMRPATRPAADACGRVTPTAV
ncbi:SgcJ/EcaC family oxidoreductase [Streptomyces sp. NPDC096205]|uniref:SgcJ/EcaC family oxidoreductase n=1 Tax=Streptomyces sp. NPDC096205 TaxID=3366081 RepID=UPI0037F1EFA3